MNSSQLINNLSEAEDLSYLEMLDVVCSGTASQKLPVDILQALASDDDWRIRSRLIEYYDLPVEVLRILVHDNRAVRQFLTRTKRLLPLEILQALAKDPDEDVRYWLVFRQQELPAEVLQALTGDENKFVRQAASDRVKTQLLRKWRWH